MAYIGHGLYGSHSIYLTILQVIWSLSRIDSFLLKNKWWQPIQTYIL